MTLTLTSLVAIPGQLSTACSGLPQYMQRFNLLRRAFSSSERGPRSLDSKDLAFLVGGGLLVLRVVFVGDRDLFWPFEGAEEEEPDSDLDSVSRRRWWL